jgi:hypothetical protein
MAEGLAEQHTDQTAEADTLRVAYTRLQQKLTETQTRVELLVTQLRRNRASQRRMRCRRCLSADQRIGSWSDYRPSLMRQVRTIKPRIARGSVFRDAGRAFLGPRAERPD